MAGRESSRESAGRDRRSDRGDRPDREGRTDRPERENRDGRRERESSSPRTPAVRTGRDASGRDPAGSDPGRPEYTGDASRTRGESSRTGQPGVGGRPSSTPPARPAAPRRSIPLSVPILAGCFAAFVVGGIAGTLRFSLPVPLLLTAGAGAAVGVVSGVFAGGRTAGLRLGVLAGAGGLGCVAALWSWAALFLWVRADVGSFLREKHPVFNASPEWQGRFDSRFNGIFNFDQFLRFRFVEEGGLDSEAGNFNERLMKAIGGQSYAEFLRNPTVTATGENGLGGDHTRVPGWVKTALVAKLRHSSWSALGGPVEPNGPWYPVVLALEIVLAGVAAVVAYLLYVGSLGARVEEYEVREVRDPPAPSRGA